MRGYAELRLCERRMRSSCRSLEMHLMSNAQRLPELDGFHRRVASDLGRQCREQGPDGEGKARARTVRDGTEAQGAFGELALDRGPQEPPALRGPRLRFRHQRSGARARAARAASTIMPTPGCSMDVLEGTESLERYDRVDDGTKPDYAEIKLSSVTTGSTGQGRSCSAAQYPRGAGRSDEVGGDHRSQPEARAGNSSAGPLRSEEQHAHRGLRADAGALRTGGLKPRRHRALTPRYCGNP